MRDLKLIFLFLGSAILWMACSNDDIPKQVNEEEVITEVSLIFTDESGTSTAYTYIDPKYREESYEDPIIYLESDKNYTVNTAFYDKSNPEEPEDITQEVMEEKNDHFVEYRFHAIDINITRIDEEESTDDDGIKIGVYTEWETGETSEGSVQQTLIHQPETKNTENPNGNHTGGETDVEVVFDVIIE